MTCMPCVFDNDIDLQLYNIDLTLKTPAKKKMWEGKMFACQYKTNTNAMLKIHHNTMQKEERYICKKCGMHNCEYLTTTKGSFHQHQQVVH